MIHTLFPIYSTLSVISIWYNVILYIMSIRITIINNETWLTQKPKFSFKIPSNNLILSPFSKNQTFNRAFLTWKKEIPIFISNNFSSTTKRNNKKFMKLFDKKPKKITFLIFNLKVSIVKVINETIIHRMMTTNPATSIKPRSFIIFKNI